MRAPESSRRSTCSAPHLAFIRVSQSIKTQGCSHRAARLQVRGARQGGWSAGQGVVWRGTHAVSALLHDEELVQAPHGHHRVAQLHQRERQEYLRAERNVR